MKWNEVTRINLQGNILVFKDAMIMLSEDEEAPEWPFIYCDPGEYIFEIDVPTPFNARRARMRLIDSEPERGGEIGVVEIDNAFLGAIDYENCLRAAKENFAEYDDWTVNNLFDELDINFSGEIDFKDTKMLYVKSGDGDGSYPCFELVCDGKQVGMECVFIE